MIVESTQQYLFPRLTAGLLFIVTMAACLLKAVGLGAARQCTLLGHAFPSSNANRSKPLTSEGGRNPTVGGSIESVCQPSTYKLCAVHAPRVRAGITVVSMESKLSKTAISRMRVAELKQELAERGLEETGTRPVLQARLGEAAEDEWARSVMGRAHQRSRRRSAGTLPAEAGASIAPPPPGLARGVGAAKHTRVVPRSQQRSRSTSAGSPVSKPARTSSSPTHVLQFDGGSRGNPGPSGAGAVLYRLDGNGARQEVWSGSLWAGPGRTNNEAEYMGLIEGLRAAKDLGVKRLTVEGDSQLVIRQMLGMYKVSSPNMVPLFKKAKNLAKVFQRLELEHIDRARNGRADTLANIAMDTRKSSSFIHPDFGDSTKR